MQCRFGQSNALQKGVQKEINVYISSILFLVLYSAHLKWKKKHATVKILFTLLKNTSSITVIEHIITMHAKQHKKKNNHQFFPDKDPLRLLFITWIKRAEFREMFKQVTATIRFVINKKVIMERSSYLEFNCAYKWKLFSMHFS